MTTINGKLIAIDRQELDLAKQQIADLQQQYERLYQSSITGNIAKEQIEKDISSIQQLQSRISAIKKKKIQSIAKLRQWELKSKLSKHT